MAKGSLSQKKLTAETARIDSIIPNPRNDNTHTQEQLGYLRASLKERGQLKPVLVRKENRMIIAGEGVWTAARELKWEKIEILLWDCDQRTADRYLVADNQIGAKSRIDANRRRAILEDVDLGELPSLGFTEDEFEKLFDDGASRGDLEVTEIDTTDVLDTFWITVHGPLEQQAYALSRLRDVMKDLVGVEVELGTTPGA